MKHLDNYKFYEGYSWKEDILASDKQSKIDDIKDILTELSDIDVKYQITTNFANSLYQKLNSKNDLAFCKYYREYSISITKYYNPNKPIESFIEFNNAMNYVVKMLNVEFDMRLFDHGKIFIIELLDLNNPLDGKTVFGNKSLIRSKTGVDFYTHILETSMSKILKYEISDNTTITIYPLTKSVEFVLSILNRVFRNQLEKNIITIGKSAGETLKLKIKKV